jgi:hypothetical protein
MFLERDLVRLIMQLNPYATPPIPFVSNMTFVGPPVSAAVIAARDAAVAAAQTANALDAGVPPDLTVFDFETQDNPAYQMDWRWMFKGHERIIRRALRFQYRYPVLNGGGARATDHLLIGYEGGGGP